jgi:hypothetical protein
MIGPVVENLIGAFLSPRRSVRRLIDGGFGVDAALLLVLLGFAVRQIFVLITPGVLPEGTSITLSEYFMELMQSYVTFGFMTIVVYQVGRFFGGKGTLIGAALTMGWYLLVVSVFTPVVLPAFVEFLEAAKAAAASPDTPPEIPGAALLALIASSCFMLWLLAAYIAEMHRFTRTWNVLFVVIGLSIPFSMLASALMPIA